MARPNPKPNTHTAEHARHVYDTTRWQRYLWEQRTAASEPVRDAVTAVQNALTEDGVKPGEHEAAWTPAEEFGGETFARLYNDPSRLEAPEGPAWMTKAHDLLDGMPEFESMRQGTMGDPDFATLGTKSLLHAVAEKLPDLLKEMEDEDDDGDKDAGGAGRGPTAEDKFRSAVRSACRDAAEEVTQVRQALAGLAPGLESTPPQHTQGDPRRLLLAERLKDDPALREVLKRAGRIARISQKRQQVRCEHAREEAVDVERGGDVARILPAQLAGLRHPALRKLTLRSIVERTAVQYRLEGKEPLGRGPIVVLLDESGSMSGDPHMWARAIGIAAVQQGLREHREVTVCGFDTRITSAHRIDAMGRGYDAGGYPRDNIGTGCGDGAEVVLRIASIEVHGGTDFTQPMQFAMAAGLRNDKADFIFVTDGQADIAPEVLAELTEAKAKRDVRVYGVVLNGGSATRAVRAICDSVVELDRQGDKGDALGKGVL